MADVVGDMLQHFDDWLLPLSSLLQECGKDAEVAVQPHQLNPFG